MRHRCDTDSQSTYPTILPNWPGLASDLSMPRLLYYSVHTVRPRVPFGDIQYACDWRAMCVCVFEVDDGPCSGVQHWGRSCFMGGGGFDSHL